MPRFSGLARCSDRLSRFRRESPHFCRFHNMEQLRATAANAVEGKPRSAKLRFGTAQRKWGR